MARRHVVVDGSNIATEGRSSPSLAQLDQAVREFLKENPDDAITVVVDATFGHRIDPSELQLFEEAEAAGEVVSPPAGAIGRGDAFLLRIAEKTGATVLSNDSFQEFHGEHPWLFEEGRLIGGKPVPEVGWIFTPRSPVRGPKSRMAVKKAARQQRDEAESPADRGLDLAARGKARTKKVERAIAQATEEAVGAVPARRRRRATPPSEPVNAPLAFITFIASHPLGTEVTGEVVEFSSHGAFVESDGARCYIPLSAMGDPPPRSAREVLSKGEQRSFVVQALDPQRRGIELALPGFAKPAGAPTQETLEAEIHPRGEQAEGAEPAARAPRRATAQAAMGAAATAPAKRAAKKAAEAGSSDEEAPSEASPKITKSLAKKTASPTKRSATGTNQPPPEAEKATPARKQSARAAEKAAPAGKQSARAAEKATAVADRTASTAAAMRGAPPARKAGAGRKGVPSPEKDAASPEDASAKQVSTPPSKTTPSAPRSPNAKAVKARAAKEATSKRGS